MLKLRISPQEAQMALETVPHKRFQNVLARHWALESDRYVKPESMCWLFCWAKTGMGSQRTAHIVQDVFDGIFYATFDRFDAKVEHEWARKARYGGKGLSEELGRRLETP